MKDRAYFLAIVLVMVVAPIVYVVVSIIVDSRFVGIVAYFGALVIGGMIVWAVDAMLRRAY